MSASPSLIANEGETSPSAPSALSASPEAGHAMHAELLRLREEVAHLRRRLANQPQGAHECEDGVPPKPIETESEFETPDKDRCTDSFPSPSEGLQVSFNEVRRSDWALRERAYRCARDFFMSPDGVTGAGRVVRAQLLSAMRQREPEVAAFFESPRQQFRCLLVEGDPEGIIEWDDFVNCYVRQCKQSISAAKAMEPERERSPATASTRSPVLPLQRCSEVSGRNATCFSEDVSPSRLQDSLLISTSSAEEDRGALGEQTSPQLMLWSTGLAHRSAERWAQVFDHDRSSPAQGSRPWAKAAEVNATSDVASPSSETYCSSTSPPRRPRLAWSTAPGASIATVPCSSRTCSGRSRSHESAQTATPSRQAANSPSSPWGGDSRPSSPSRSRDPEQPFVATRASIAESFAKAQAEPLKAPRLNWKLPASAAGPLPPAAEEPAASPRHSAGSVQPPGLANELVSVDAPASLRANTPRAIRTDRLPQAVSIVFPQPMLSQPASLPPAHMLPPPMPSTSCAQPSQIRPHASPCAPSLSLNGNVQAGSCAYSAIDPPAGPCAPQIVFALPGRPRSVSPVALGMARRASLQRSCTPPPAVGPSSYVTYGKAWPCWTEQRLAGHGFQRRGSCPSKDMQIASHGVVLM